MSGCFAFIHISAACVCSSLRGHRRSWISSTWSYRHRQQPCERWESKAGYLEKQTVILTVSHLSRPSSIEFLKLTLLVPSWIYSKLFWIRKLNYWEKKHEEPGWDRKYAWFFLASDDAICQLCWADKASDVMAQHEPQPWGEALFVKQGRTDICWLCENIAAETRLKWLIGGNSVSQQHRLGLTDELHYLMAGTFITAFGRRILGMTQ